MLFALQSKIRSINTAEVNFRVDNQLIYIKMSLFTTCHRKLPRASMWSSCNLHNWLCLLYAPTSQRTPQLGQILFTFHQQAVLISSTFNQEYMQEKLWLMKNHVDFMDFKMIVFQEGSNIISWHLFLISHYYFSWNVF